MILQIDTEEMQRLGLKENEVLVYAILKYQCEDGKALEINYSKIGELSFCGSRPTIRRTIEKLIKKGVLQNKRTTCPPERTTCPPKRTTCPENGQLVQKEKRTKKEKNNLLVCYFDNNKAHAPGKPDVLVEKNNNREMMPPAEEASESGKLLPKKESEIPSETGYYKIIVGEYGYLNPRPIVAEFRNYYNAHGWPQGNKLHLMRVWMQRESRLAKGRQPSMNMEERTYLKGLLNLVDQRKVCQFCDDLRKFEMREDCVIFYFDEAKLNAVTRWLGQYVDKMKAAYQKEMKSAQLT